MWVGNYFPFPVAALNFVTALVPSRGRPVSEVVPAELSLSSRRVNCPLTSSLLALRRLHLRAEGRRLDDVRGGVDEGVDSRHYNNSDSGSDRHGHGHDQQDRFPEGRAFWLQYWLNSELHRRVFPVYISYPSPTPE